MTDTHSDNRRMASEGAARAGGADGAGRCRVCGGDDDKGACEASHICCVCQVSMEGRAIAQSSLEDECTHVFCAECLLVSGRAGCACAGNEENMRD